MQVYTWILFSWYMIIKCEFSTATKNSICRCEKNAFNGKPFVAIWNSPTIGCDFNFSTPVHLQRFGIFENDHQTWDGKRVTVFSSAQLGLYPYFVLNGDQNYNGGLPQLIDLNQHLRKARVDIMNKIPDPNYNGLAVIDWEPWRPIWDTNWNTKRIYKVRSVELVRNQHPTWPLSRLIEQAKHEFEDSARALFEHTITLGKELRPKALWGFYGFPDCFAHEENRYQCSPDVQKQNDRLEWLYSASAALFPSMYLLDEHPDNQDYVLGRMREALRFATKGFGKTRRHIPIFVYHRNIYENNLMAFNFLSKTDLDNTIGLAADLGAAGVVVWGNRFDENTSPEVCRKIDNYVTTSLGPYIQNKMRQVESCSAAHCNQRGHCVQRALLTPELLQKYEEEHRVDSCSGPTSPFHTGNIIQKKTEVPIPNITHADITSFNITSLNISLPANVSGYNIDLGVKHINGDLVDNSAMDDFFQQLNRTSKRNNTFSGRGQKSKNRTVAGLNLKTHTGGVLLHNQSLPQQGHSHGNTTRTRSFGKAPKGSNVKKSAIPRPPKLQHNLHNASSMANEKKSMLVHKLLSSVQGSLITTPELLRRHNLTKLNQLNNSRKSQILKSTGAKLPSMSTKKSRRSWLPHMYVILIGVSLGGALMFSVIFVAVYYYISLRNTFPSYKDGAIFQEEEKTTHMPPKAHSSPKGSESFNTKDYSTPDESEKRKERSREKRNEVNENTTKMRPSNDGEQITEKRIKRVKSVERRNELDVEKNPKEKSRERSTSQSDDRRHRARSQDSGRKLNENKGQRNSEKRSVSRERRKIPTELTRSQSKREKVRQPKNSEEEVEINIQDLN